MDSLRRQEPANVFCSQCGVSVRCSNFARHLRLHQAPTTGPAPTYVLSVPMIQQQQPYLSPTDRRRSAGSNTTHESRTYDPEQQRPQSTGYAVTRGADADQPRRLG